MLLNYNFTVFIFACVDKSVFIVIKMNLIAVRKNFDHIVKTFCKSLCNIFFRNIVTAFSDTVFYSDTAFIE